MADNRHHEQMMAKEKELSLKIEELQRRMETEAIQRERAIEEKVQHRMKLQGERFE